MKFLSNILIILFSTGLIFFFSCKKPQKYPIIPAIEYVGFTKIDNGTGHDDKGTLTISFTDGDGDIGLSDTTLSPPYNKGSKFYYDLFIVYYEKQHGVYVAVKLPDVTDSARIPVVTPTGENKSIKGTIQDELFINNFSSPHDTIAFDVSLADRALHISNIIRTPDIIIKK
jgi:hypothetical protein